MTSELKNLLVVVPILSLQRKLTLVDYCAPLELVSRQDERMVAQRRNCRSPEMDYYGRSVHRVDKQGLVP